MHSSHPGKPVSESQLHISYVDTAVTLQQSLLRLLSFQHSQELEEKKYTFSESTIQTNKAHGK